MKYSFLKLIIFSIISVTLMGFTGPTNSNMNLPTPETPIYLKLNEFFILYTYPKSPFIDGRNRLLIPLDSVKDLMGGDFYYDEKTKTATIHWLGHTYQSTIGSKHANVDGKTVSMDTFPVLIDNIMFIPIRLLIDSADIGIKWDSKYKFLTLTGESVASGKVIQYFKGQDMAQIQNENAFVLMSYSWIRNKSGVPELHIRAKNITGETIPDGKADIHPLVYYKSSFSMDSYNRPLHPNPQTVKEDAIITKSQPFSSANHETVIYVISVGRQLK